MFFHPKNLENENNNPWFKPWFNILLHTQSIVCATVDSQCLEYLVMTRVLKATGEPYAAMSHAELINQNRHGFVIN